MYGNFYRDFFQLVQLPPSPFGTRALTPADVHYGRVEERVAARQVVLSAAYESAPEQLDLRWCGRLTSSQGK